MLIILNIAITICFTSYYDSDFSVFLSLRRRGTEPLAKRGCFCCYVGWFIFFLAASLVQLILLLDLLSFA